jgi:hypothetical protein
MDRSVVARVVRDGVTIVESLTMRRWVLGILLLALGGCASPPAPLPLVEPAAVVVQVDPAVDPDFRLGRERLLDQLDAPDRSLNWTESGEVLLGVKLERGTRSRIWYARIRVATADECAETGYREPVPMLEVMTIRTRSGEEIDVAVTSRFVPLRLDVFDADANPIGHTIAPAPRALFAEGIHPAAARHLEFIRNGRRITLRRPEAGRAADEVAQCIATQLELVKFIGMAAATRPIQDAAADVIVRINPLSFLFGPRRFQLSCNLAEVSAASAPWAAAGDAPEAVRIPIELQHVGRPVTIGSLTSTRVGAPYHLAAGVTEVVLQHPDHPDRRLTIQVIGGRR